MCSRADDSLTAPALHRGIKADNVYRRRVIGAGKMAIGDSTHDESQKEPSRRKRTFGWILVGLLITALHAMWSLAIPRTASPDEQSHIVRAAAVARGQWSGEVGPAPTDASRPGAATVVRLPSDYKSVLVLPDCFAFHPDQPASCQHALPDAESGLIDVETYAGQYPPLYYALVGWPSLFTSAGPAIYGMRLVSGLLASALLIWGAARMRSFVPAAPLMWAALAAVTPMCLYLGASVNPQALEISAGFAFWAACLALARTAGPPQRSVLVQAGVTGALLISSRADGPLWAAVAVVVALIFAPAGRWRVLWSARGTRWTLLAGVGAGVLAAAWITLHGGVVTANGLYPQYASPGSVIRAVLPATDGYLLQMVGNFGWLDSPSPWLTTLLWFVIAGALLLMAVAVRASARERAALLLAMLAVVAAPVVLQIPTAADTGIIWQGRYILPVAVGVPLIAAVLLAQLDPAAADVVRRISRWAIPTLAFAHVAAFWSALRRYSVGFKGELLTWSPAWSSPLGYLSAIFAYTLLIAAIGGLAWRAVGPATSNGTGHQPSSESLEDIPRHGASAAADASTPDNRPQVPLSAASDSY